VATGRIWTSQWTRRGSLGLNPEVTTNEERKTAGSGRRGSVFPIGINHVVWNGVNESGLPVASDVYFYRLRASGKTEQRRMMLVKPELTVRA